MSADATAATDTSAGGYLRRLPLLAPFPLDRSVLLILLGLAVITTPLYWCVAHNIIPGVGLYGMLLIKGLEAAVYFRFVVATAYGHEHIDPPDFGDMWEDLLAPIVRYLFALAPIIVGVLWYGDIIGSKLLGLLLLEEKPTRVFDHTGPAAMVCVGVALLPLLTIIAAISRSAFAVIHPTLWLRALRIIGVAYVAAALAFYLVLAVEVLLWVPLLLEIREQHSIPLVTSVITLTLSYLPMALRARLLGALVRPHFAQLDATGAR